MCPFSPLLAEAVMGQAISNSCSLGFSVMMGCNLEFQAKIHLYPPNLLLTGHFIRATVMKLEEGSVRIGVEVGL